MNKKILHHEVHTHTYSKEWVVFMHGAGGSTATWKLQINSFKSHYNVLLLDLRDHGLSKNIVPDYDYYNFNIITTDVIAVLELLSIKKAHFITLSFGSVLLQDLSIKHPEIVASAIFAGGIFKANIWIKSFVHLARGLNKVLPYKMMYSIFSYLLMPRKRHQRSRQIYKRQAQKLSSKEYLKWVGLYAEFFQLLNRFYNQKINFPALVIMGDEDYIFLKSARAFTKNQPYVNLVEIFQAGHICNIDRPELFNQLALSFLIESTMLSEHLPTIQTQ